MPVFLRRQAFCIGPRSSPCSHPAKVSFACVEFYISRNVTNAHRRANCSKLVIHSQQEPLGITEDSLRGE